MTNWFEVTLDTISPSNVLFNVANDAQYTPTNLVNCSLTTGDTDTTNYQMKLWGDIDLTWAINNGLANTGSTVMDENSAIWIGYVSTKQIQLSAGDGSKNVYAKIRDDVYNESSQVSDGIILDATLPIVSVTVPQITKVSTITGRDAFNFSFTVDCDFIEYKVKFVTTTGATQETGIQIGTGNGSQNVSGTGGFLSSSAINVTIKGEDLKIATGSDGKKIIKVFVKDQAGNWSV